MFIFNRFHIKTLLTFISLFSIFQICGQENCIGVFSADEIQNIEQFILKDKLIEARNIMNSISSKPICEHEKLLFDILQERIITNDKMYRFLVKTFELPGIGQQQFSDFVNENVKVPEITNELDFDYVKIKWLQMMVLADDATTLKEAKKVRDNLLQYIMKFKQNSSTYLKAKELTQSLEIIIYLIQGEIDKGKALCIKTFDLGKKLNDSLLQIIGLYHLCDFLVVEGDLEAFIKKSEEVYRIEATMPYASPFKTKNMIHLIDAYIFKGGKEERVKKLLQILYNNPKSRPHSFSLYAQFLARLPRGNEVQKEIFKKFKVNSYVEFSHLIDTLSKSVLVPNEYFHVLNLTAKMLYNKKEYEMAFLFKDKAIEVNNKTYAEDLSQTLADLQTEKAVQEQKQELKLTRQKSKFSSIIAILVAALLVISLGLLVNNTKKNRSLRQKNEIIQSSLKEKEYLLYEKQLLFKEMHHRIKNNFQLLSSLLELQNNNIKDEHALKMAEEGQNRIRSMALIHQRLYENDSLSISVSEFVNKLVEEISGLSDIKPKCKINIPDYKFDVDTVIPLGLILNELLTNAFKYGFSTKNPELKVSIVQIINQEAYQLFVWDNGKGLNTKISFEKSSSMGLWLVKRLSKQLMGTADYKYSNGSLFTISFKDTQSRLKIA